MQTLKLDITQWRCGGDGFPVSEENYLGEETTLLLDPYEKKHNMCCLGQFALQLGYTAEDIELLTEPIEIERITPEDDILHTSFAENAIEINDDKTTSIGTKIELLTKLCKDYGYELVIKNADQIPRISQSK